jgi:hypothetical protein
MLADLARTYGIASKSASDIVKDIVTADVDARKIDTFIKGKYAQKIHERQDKISDDELLKELHKVTNFQWGVVQGQLDNKIQVQYVRKYPRYDALLANISKGLYPSVRDYVICSWYNHWTTLIIEDLISTHPKVVPTLKNIKGVDLFFDGQPFDLKTTYMPAGYPKAATGIVDLKDLAVWLYENQGVQRFGSDNRLFVIVYDKDNPEDGWKIKRDIQLVKESICTFFEKERVSQKDEIVFAFGKNTYTAITKVLLIGK